MIWDVKVSTLIAKDSVPIAVCVRDLFSSTCKNKTCFTSGIREGCNTSKWGCHRIRYWRRFRTWSLFSKITPVCLIEPENQSLHAFKVGQKKFCRQYNWSFLPTYLVPLLISFGPVSTQMTKPWLSYTHGMIANSATPCCKIEMSHWQKACK